ncbi:MAG: hypothetical protein AAFQ65_10815 [Myxococcota bacterium]
MIDIALELPTTGRNIRTSPSNEESLQDEPPTTGLRDVARRGVSWCWASVSEDYGACSTDICAGSVISSMYNTLRKDPLLFSLNPKSIIKILLLSFSPKSIIKIHVQGRAVHQSD